jgi:hypothetical protein
MTRKNFAGAFLSHLIAALLILLGGFSLPALGQVSFATRYTVVQAASPLDLLEMERRLHFSAPVSNSPHQMTTGAFAFHPGFPRLAAKIDAILLRTSQILNLQPSQPPRLHIVLAADGKEVQRRYLLIMPDQRRGLFGFGSLEGYYETGNRTIYLSLRDLHEGILAHEMAHDLLCTRVCPPPSASDQEAWAHYVESRL